MFGKKVIKIFLTIIMIFIWTGCKKSNLNESRSPGEKTFVTYCKSCHVLPKPNSKTDKEWPEIVERYGARAKLSDEQINQIISYLIANN